LKYLSVDGMVDAARAAVRVGIDQSDVTFSLASDGRVQSIHGTSHMHMDFSLGSAEHLAVVTEIQIENPRVGRAPDLIGSLAHARPKVTSSAIVTQRPDPEEARAEADDRLLEGRSTESLLADAF